MVSDEEVRLAATRNAIAATLRVEAWTEGRVV
jgi:hypothetical protein